jgi:RNA polymerase sigma factor (TIGR02999 family)
VHEAYLKLSEYGASVDDRQHLVNLVIRTMRQIVIDEARRRNAEKHGGKMKRVDFELALAEPLPEVDLLALAAAVDQIKISHPRMGQVVEMHFFAGIEFSDIAELLTVDRKTIYRDWATARVMLAAELGA